jgi:2-methylcitrate dehydratase
MHHYHGRTRPAAGPAIASILAAEKIAPLRISDVQQVVVEVHRMALERTAAGGPPWSLESREDADHSTPYLVAVALRDGTVTLASFSDAHLWNPELRE